MSQPVSDGSFIVVFVSKVSPASRIQYKDKKNGLYNTV